VLVIAIPRSCPAVYQRKRAASGTAPEIAQTLLIRIVFAEDGLRPLTPGSDLARLPSAAVTIPHKSGQCKLFSRRAVISESRPDNVPAFQAERPCQYGQSAQAAPLPLVVFHAALIMSVSAVNHTKRGRP
jgi:hypothetical protein